MVWIKQGNIFDPRDYDWAGTHAQVPTVLVKKDLLRIFYADRNEKGKSYTTYIDVDKKDPKKIIYFHKKPILPLGKPGTFDDEGVMTAFVIENGDKVFLYYTGWNVRGTVPYHNATGLAVSHDGGATFEKMFEGPLLDRTPYEPYLAVTPWVLKEKDIWHIWYISGTKWELVGQKYEPVYVIKYADSKDGIHWNRSNIVCVPQKNDLEALSHPSIIKDGDTYRMWYSYRDSHDYRDGKGSYTMGYAESKDAKHFTRIDEKAGIGLSKEGWDSTMLCYPYVVNVDGTLYMFYNGNSFGQTGFGYAIWKD